MSKVFTIKAAENRVNEILRKSKNAIAVFNEMRQRREWLIRKAQFS